MSEIGERSKGKARPSLPRSRELQSMPADTKPTGGRNAHGHFAGGNPFGRDARFKAAVKKNLGVATEGEAGIVTSDAKRVFNHILRALPSDAPPVRTLLGIHARHVALNAYFTAKAEAAGLDTPAGLQALEVADRQSQRAERLLVTILDVARVCASTASRRGGSKLERLRLLASADGATEDAVTIEGRDE